MPGKAVPILRFRGLVITLDASWLLILPLMVWSLATGHFPTVFPGAAMPLYLAMAGVTTLAVMASLILHEMAHAAVARRYGQSYPAVLLALFGGVAAFQPQPAHAKAGVLIAVAGPVASLFIALACAADAALADLSGLPAVVQHCLTALAWINLGLAVVNLLPAFPLDGGRVLLVWLSALMGDMARARRRTAIVSTAVSFSLIALGLVTLFADHAIAGPWLIVIGLSVRAGLQATLARQETRAAADGLIVGDLMTRNPVTATPDQTLAQLVNQIFLARGISFVPVLEDGVLLGYIDTQVVSRIDREHWTTTIIDDVIEPLSPGNTVDCKMAGSDLITRMLGSGRRKFMVTDGGRLVGVITLCDALPLMQGPAKTVAGDRPKHGVQAQNLRYTPPDRG